MLDFKTDMIVSIQVNLKKKKKNEYHIYEVENSQFQSLCIYKKKKEERTFYMFLLMFLEL